MYLIFLKKQLNIKKIINKFCHFSAQFRDIFFVSPDWVPFLN